MIMMWFGPSFQISPEFGNNGLWTMQLCEPTNLICNLSKFMWVLCCLQQRERTIHPTHPVSSTVLQILHFGFFFPPLCVFHITPRELYIVSQISNTAHFNPSCPLLSAQYFQNQKFNFNINLQKSSYSSSFRITHFSLETKFISLSLSPSPTFLSYPL